MTVDSAVKGVVFDISGTVLDFGSRGPVVAFVELFRRYGVEITAEEARGPMGTHKIDHILSLLNDPAISLRWKQVNADLPDPDGLERLYQEFTQVQIEVLGKHCDLIPGVPRIMEQLRSRGIKIANTTGFDFGMLKDLVPTAQAHGYQPDVWVTPDLVGKGRPAPWMIFHAAKAMDVYPIYSIVKVGDTPADIQEARNAGVWAVSVVQSGNEVGLSQAELEALPEARRAARIAAARSRLASAGPHYLIDTVADLMPVIDQISARIARGERP